MGTSALKSTAITNADATPPVTNNNGIDGGAVRSKIGDVTALAGDDTSSVYRFVRVKSNAYIRSVKFASAASGATGQVNIGVHQTPANGGAVVDADLFASALDPGGAAIALTDVTFESGQYTYAEAQTPLWQVLGLTSDPQREYDITASVAETIADATAMYLEVEYVI